MLMITSFPLYCASNVQVPVNAYFPLFDRQANWLWTVVSTQQSLKCDN